MKKFSDSALVMSKTISNKKESEIEMLKTKIVQLGNESTLK